MGIYIPTEVRQIVYDRAHGRCEYCLIPDFAVLAAHEIDHIVPQKHGGPTKLENLALSCALCNKHKGSDLASLDEITDNIVGLYNPRRNFWNDHFQLSGSQIMPLTPIGRVTVRLLQFNIINRLEERELLIVAGVFQVS
ncbi:MAG: HNH endonuclease signature motif containing protein [Pseudomonadota bacterium]